MSQTMDALLSKVNQEIMDHDVEEDCPPAYELVIPSNPASPISPRSSNRESATSSSAEQRVSPVESGLVPSSPRLPEIHPALRDTPAIPPRSPNRLSQVNLEPVQATTLTYKLPITVTNPSTFLLKPFPYTSELFEVGISPDSWSSISTSICNAARLSRTQHAIVVGTGVSIPLIGIGIMRGREAARKQKAKNVRKSLQDHEIEGSVANVVEAWNRELGKKLGVRIRVLVPSLSFVYDDASLPDSTESPKEENSDPKRRSSTKDKRRKSSEQRQWRIMIEPAETKQPSSTYQGASETGTSSSVDFENRPPSMELPVFELTAAASSRTELATSQTPIAELTAYSTTRMGAVELPAEGPFR